MAMIRAAFLLPGGVLANLFAEIGERSTEILPRLHIATPFRAFLFHIVVKAVQCFRLNQYFALQVILRSATESTKPNFIVIPQHKCLLYQTQSRYTYFSPIKSKQYCLS